VKFLLQSSNCGEDMPGEPTDTQGLLERARHGSAAADIGSRRQQAICSGSGTAARDLGGAWSVLAKVTDAI
jgi:hypothetical protein